MKDAPTIPAIIAAAEATHGAAPLIHGPNNTDRGNGLRLALRHGMNLHYCSGFKDQPWMHWHVTEAGGGRWRQANMGEVDRMAKDTAIGIRDEPPFGSSAAELSAYSLASQARGPKNAMIEMAASEIIAPCDRYPEGLRIPIVPEELDRHPALFNCQNGTIDMLTGEFRDAARGDLLTKMSPAVYGEKAEAPQVWLKSMSDWQPGVDGEEIQEYLGRLWCYCLTGLANLKALFFLVGPVDSGKSTMLEMMRRLCGPDYTIVVPLYMLLGKNIAQKNEYQEARFKGARIATLNETDEQVRLNTAMLKQLSGGDAMTGRNPYERSSDFDPTHKLLIGTNYMPQLSGVGKALLRRMHVIPFRQTIDRADQDPNLKDKLSAELSGILNWALGHRESWLKNGLAKPKCMVAIDEEMSEEEDRVGEFLSNYVADANGEMLVGNLWAEYRAACERLNEYVGSQSAFTQRVKEHGIEYKKFGNRRVWRLRGNGFVTPPSAAVQANNQKILNESDLFKTE